MLGSLDSVYVVQMHVDQKKDMIRIFVDGWTANITAELLRVLFPQSSVTIHKVAITESCEVLRQNDRVKLNFTTKDMNVGK